MNKEIERKYTVHPKLKLCDIFRIVKGCKNDDIKDYYFNPTTRLRFINNKAYITIKSLPDITILTDSTQLIRDEFEFQIYKKELNFIPNPMLYKTRYYYEYEGHTFEINIYPQIKDKNDRNLILVETELNDIDEEIKLPDWIHHEVSYHPAFYNFSIYSRLLSEHQ